MLDKEYGSDFHYCTDGNFFLEKFSSSLFCNESFSLFFSGRAALKHLLYQGAMELGWEKIYLPRYYCHEIFHFIQDLSLDITYYNCNPFLESQPTLFEDAANNVVVNVDFFGLSKLDLSNYKNLITVEDLTHNILAYKQSQAAYCFGSLRKEMPIPVGGFCFSPQQRPLPIAKPNLMAESVALEKLLAMVYKAKFLKKEQVDKEVFRQLFSDAEVKFGDISTNTGLPEIAKSILYRLDFNKVIAEKHKNIGVALQLLENIDGLTINLNNKKKECFGLILECSSARQKNKLKDHLISNRIFPAVLWPNQLNERDRDVENRILLIHLDYRYDLNDVSFITNIISDFYKNE